MPYWIQCWVIVARYRDDYVTCAKIVGLAVAKIQEDHVGLSVNDDVAANKNLVWIKFLGFWNCTRLAQQTVEGQQVRTP